MTALRATVVCLAAASALWSGAPAVVAQQATGVPRVGFLTGGFRPGGDRLFEAFRQGLGDHGWIDGRNIALEYRAAESREATPRLATELVQRKVDVLVLSATAINEARAVTGRIPTVFAIADDPVRAGFVASLARPGGHMTGVTTLNADLDGKRLEMLRAALPSATRVGVLAVAQDPSHRERVASTERVARRLGVQIQVLEVPTADRFAAAFDAARRERLDALMSLGTPPLFVHQPRIAELATATRVPVMSAWREFADAGGLMSYGTNVPAMFRRVASYVDRILKGAKPADLPVEQASTFELVINAKAARTLGLTLPSALLSRADHLID